MQASRDGILVADEDFLSELRSNTKNVVERLVDKVRLDLENYDDFHFDQSVFVRLHLYQFEKKLDTILQANIPDKEWYVKYALLCGLIWDMRSRFADRELADLLYNFGTRIHLG